MNTDSDQGWVIDARLFPLALDPSVRYPQVHTTNTTNTTTEPSDALYRP